MSETDMRDQLERLRKSYVERSNELADLEMKQKEYRELIYEMRSAVKTEVGKLSGLRFMSYKDAIGWLTAHNALRTGNQQ